MKKITWIPGSPFNRQKGGECIGFVLYHVTSKRGSRENLSVPGQEEAKLCSEE